MFGDSVTVVCPSCGGPPKELDEQAGVQATYMRGGRVPAALTTHIEGRPMTTDQTTAVVLRKMEPQAIQQEAKRLSKMISGFGQLDNPEVKLAVQLLDAGFHESHFNILHGKLFMNMNGRIFWAARTFGRSWAGVTHRIMTAEEREGYQLNKDEVGVIATVWKWGGPGNQQRVEAATDIGRAGGTRDANQPVAKANKAEMAVKRARSRALAAAAPLGVNMDTYDDGVIVEDAEPQAVMAPERPEIEGPDEDDIFGPEEDDVEDEPYVGDGDDTGDVREPEPDDEPEDGEYTEIPDDDGSDSEPSEEAEEPEPDVSDPAHATRTEEETQAYKPKVLDLIKKHVEAGSMRNIDAMRFVWQELKGRKAMDLAVMEGYSAAQIVELMKLQAASRDEA